MNHNDLNHFTNHANYFDLWEERPYKLINLSESPTQKDLKRKVDEIIPSLPRWLSADTWLNAVNRDKSVKTLVTSIIKSIKDF